MFNFVSQTNQERKMTTSEISQLTTQQALRTFKRNATERKVKKGETIYIFNRGENYPVYFLTIRKTMLKAGELVSTSFCGHGRVLASNEETAAGKVKQMLFDNYRFFNFKTF